MKGNSLTFRGGAHIPDYKDLTKDKPIEKALEPKVVYISLYQHVGAGCKALVKKGDEVKVGQKIGDSDSYLSAPVHSSVSGVVKNIVKMYNPDGWKTEHIVIESDGLNELHESVKPGKSLDKLSKEEIVEIVREAGIVGMGGAAFPSHAKLETAKEHDVDTVILNGAECEPYLTTDHRVMLETPDKVIQGLDVMLNYLDLESGYIGIEDNKMDAIEVFRTTIKDQNRNKVAVLKTKFPQGDSYRMVDAVANRKVPAGGRCTDVKSIVQNICTAVSIGEAVIEGKPLYERVITVTGNGIKEPKNLLVKLGTPIGDIIQQCGGFKGKPGKIIVGGPMTGHAQFSLDVCITKGVTGILVMAEEEVAPAKVSPCIKCGKCLTVCPVKLQPLLISGYSLKDRFEEAEDYNALNCIECGACSYICPSKRPLTESIGHAKREIISKRKKS